MIIFALGFLWMLMTGVQTRLISKGDRLPVLFAWAFATSMIWGYVVREVTVATNGVLLYAIGSAFGVVVAVRLSKSRWLRR